jgi:hypothetical protein
MLVIKVSARPAISAAPDRKCTIQNTVLGMIRARQRIDSTPDFLAADEYFRGFKQRFGSSMRFVH